MRLTIYIPVWLHDMVTWSTSTEAYKSLSNVQADVQVDYKQKTVTYSSVESYLRLETTILDSPVVADHLTAALFSDWLRRELFAAF